MNKSFGGFRKPVKKGSIPREGNMTLVLEGKERKEKLAFIAMFNNLNRKDKRDFIRNQEVRRRFVRKTMKIGFGGAKNKVERDYSKRLDDAVKQLSHSLRVGRSKASLMLDIKEYLQWENAQELNIRLKDIQYKTALPKEFESANKD